jgi:hypothetical protein
MRKFSGIALNPIEQKQFTDHLAPLSIALGVPLLFLNEEMLEEAKLYYPGLTAEFLPFEEFNPEWLIAHYDFSILSDQWPRDELRQKFALLEQKYGKRFRNVHCPHGFSDKGFYLKGCAFEDICLIYGQNMLDLLKEWGVEKFLNSYVTIGNIRLTYYRQHQAFYQQLIQEQILDKFPNKQPIILFAPTSEDKENLSSYFDVAEKLFTSLPSHYNLIVKLHPQLQQVRPGPYLRLLAKFEKQANIQFLSDFPLIYPLLDISDIYLGDMSSIGYDFLAFQRPMFFLNQQRRTFPPDRSAFLFQCGKVIQPEQYDQIFSIIELELPNRQYETRRAEIYHYTFGDEQPFGTIKKQLKQLLLDGKT